MAASECAPLDLGCKAGEWANSVVGDAIQNMADAVMEAFGKAVASLGTLWVNVGTPNLTGTGGGSSIAAGASAPNSDGIITVLGWVTWIAIALAAISIILLGALIASWMRNGEGFQAAGRLGIVLGAIFLISGATALVSGLLPNGPQGAGGTVLFLQSSLWWYMGAAAVVSVIIGGVRMAWEQRAEPGKDTIKSLLTLIVVAGAGVTIVGLLVSAFDSFSVWILNGALNCDVGMPAVGKEAVIVNKSMAEDQGIEMNAWISIDTKGKVTIINHRAEMGQGSYQAVPQIIAEELEVDLNDVNIIFGKGNNTKYGSQITGGSSTVRGTYTKLLNLSASAREMLIQTAAKRWGAEPNACYAENGQVIHKSSGKKLGYGELVEEASKLEAPKEVALKNIKDYKILRKPLPRQDTPLKVNGQAIFGMDKKLPGMLYAVVERNPRFLGKVKSFDASATKATPGVKHVLKVQMNVFSHKREGIAIVADNLWSAMQGRKVLKVEWDDSGFEHPSTEQLYTKMNEQVKGDVLSFKTKGNVESIFKNSANKVEAVYETPYESHSCMEPVNCIANVVGDKCEIWGPIQGPDWIQDDLSTQLGIPKENVTVNMTFLGGGFGRKAFTDYPHEAAIISKEINAPVQVVWTREDDMTQGPFRPGMVYQCTGALNEGGRIDAFETKMAGQNMGHQNPGANKLSYNDSVTEGFLETYLNSFPNYSFGDAPLDSPIPVMWWRSVYSSTNGFAFESFIDELAIKAGKDPMQFRRDHIWEGRYLELMNKLEAVSGWKSRSKNSGYGLAITECFSSIVGEVVKVSKIANGKIKIDKVWAVMDCGWYVNPDIIHAQVEGSIIMALGAATMHATHFQDGMAVEKNFNTYKIPRITDIPEIEVHVIDNEEKAGGVGEPGLPPFTPALTNAIFDLTGKRIRKLPFNLEEV